MPYYYVTDYDYEIGAVLQKGRWKEFVKEGHEYYPLEQWLEKIRVKDNLSLVSRLDCFYAFIRSGDAEGFAKFNEKKNIYEVEPCDENCLIKKANYEAYTYLRKLPSEQLKNEEHIMLIYWLNEESFISPDTGRVAHAPEALINSNVRIIKRF